jgi:hypothetical protein
MFRDAVYTVDKDLIDFLDVDLIRVEGRFAAGATHF